MSNQTFTIEKKFCTYTLEELVTEDGMFVTGYQFTDFDIKDNLGDYIYFSYEYFSSPFDVDRYIDDCEAKLEIISVMIPYLTNMENYSYYGENIGIPEAYLEEVVEDLYKLITKSS